MNNKMQLVHTALLYALYNSLASSALSPANPKQHPLSDQAANPSLPSPSHEILVRPATRSDIDAITDIIVDAWAPAPYFKYLYQFRQKYPEYHWECERQEIEDLFDVKAKYPDIVWINVIDSPASTGKPRKAVSVGAWVFRNISIHDSNIDTSTNSPDLPLLSSFPFSPLNPLPQPHSFTPSKSKHKNFNCSASLDLNTTRAAHWNKQMSRYQRQYIDDAYTQQLYLGILGTHPDFDGNGYGRAQCEWGMRLAPKLGNGDGGASQGGYDDGVLKERSGDAVSTVDPTTSPPAPGKIRPGVNLTLIATPAGYDLYKTIPFQSVKNLSFTKVGGEALVWFEIMRWNPWNHSS